MASSRVNFTLPLFQRWNILDGPVSIVIDIMTRGQWSRGSIPGAGALMLLFISNSKQFLGFPLSNIQITPSVTAPGIKKSGCEATQ